MCIRKIPEDAPAGYIVTGGDGAEIARRTGMYNHKYRPFILKMYISDIFLLRSLVYPENST